MRALLKYSLMALLLLSPFTHAEENLAQKSYTYFGLEPDVVTNYISETKKIGFVNVGVEIMTATDGSLEVIEKHQPLIRDKIISILGQQSPQKLRSLKGREEIRKTIQNELNMLLKKESGKEAIENLLFTKFLLM